MKDDGPSICGRSSELSVNDEASSRIGNVGLVLATRRLRYRMIANPSDKRKRSPTMPPTAPANVSVFVRVLARC